MINQKTYKFLILIILMPDMDFSLHLSESWLSSLNGYEKHSFLVLNNFQRLFKLGWDAWCGTWVAVEMGFTFEVAGTSVGYVIREKVESKKTILLFCWPILPLPSPFFYGEIMGK